MKNYKRLFIIICCTVVLFSNFFMCYTVPVFASQGVYDPDTSWWEKFTEESSAYLSYLACRVGAIVKDHDFSKWVQARSDYKEWWNTGHISRLEDSNGNENFSFDKELMEYIKNCLEEYLKTEQCKEENGGFYLLPTTKFIDVPSTSFSNSFKYQTFRNIVLEKGLLVVNIRDMAFVDLFSDPEHPKQIYFTFPSSPSSYLNNPDSVVYASFMCAYDWVLEKTMHPIMMFEEVDKVHKSCSEAVQASTSNNGFIDTVCVNGYQSYNYTLYSTTGEMVRVFVSQNAAKNYSVGSRKVFVTQNFYDYEPEDLTVSIADLQKSVSDLQKIIDELLKRVTDNSSEKEIMELLRLILEELRNQQGTGSGGGTGDVTVSVDLKETNSWLSKIYDKVSQIFEKMDSAIKNAGQSALDKIQESLDEIIKQLKAIKGWTIAGTIIDGVDAVADWLDFISDMLTDADSGVATISSTMDDAANLLKTKFPFCIPWDVYFLVSFLSHEPETPVFSLPIKLERLGIDEYIEVDMSQFKVVSDISRTLLTLIYCYALLNLTMKIFPMTKEET